MGNRFFLFFQRHRKLEADTGSGVIVATLANLTFQGSDIGNVHEVSSDSVQISVLHGFETHGRQEELIRERKRSCEREKHLHCSTHYVTLIIIPIIWLN